jgi:hypothetical protein
LPKLQLTVGREHPRSTGSIVVERGWVQTWIGGGLRQDRAVYRVSSSEGQVSIELPEGVSLEHVHVKVNGESPPLPTEMKRTIAVNLRGSNSTHHVLELKYQFADNGEDTGTIEAKLPRFVGNVGVQHLYWHLAVPGDRHLIDADEQLTPEFTWQWHGVGWERRSSREQAELEKWIGAESDGPLPASTNQYLFSLAGSPQKVVVWTAARGHLVFWISLAVLVFGLLLIYFRAFRHPLALFTAGVVVAGLAAWQTESALLFVQAALLGLGLVLLAVVIEFTQSGRRGSPQIVRSAGSSIVESRPAPTSVRTAEPIIPPSTESLPVEAEIPAAESSSR